MRLQLTRKAGVKQNQEHGEAGHNKLMFTSLLWGPLEIFVWLHLPREGERESGRLHQGRLEGLRVLVGRRQQGDRELDVRGVGEARVAGGGMRERVALGPVLLGVEGGEMRVKLRNGRSSNTPRYKSIEEWRVVK